MILVIIGTLYAAAVGYLVLFQRDFVFHPGGALAAPAGLGLESVETVEIRAEDGTRLTAHAVTLAIKRLRKRAGIPRLHPHLFRHSAAVAYIMNGGDQFGLKRIFGHEQLSTTDGYMDYAQQHLAHQHKRFSPMAKVTEPRRPSGTQRTKRRDEEEQ